VIVGGPVRENYRRANRRRVRAFDVRTVRSFGPGTHAIEQQGLPSSRSILHGGPNAPMCGPRPAFDDALGLVYCHGRECYADFWEGIAPGREHFPPPPPPFVCPVTRSTSEQAWLR